MSEYRTLPPGQQAQIWVGGPAIREPQLLFQTNEMLIEAPNWSLDGASLFLNGHGSLWRLDPSAPGQGLTVVDFDGLPELNNDHVLDPGGDHIYLSAMDGHIYRGHLAGGAVERVTPEDGAWHFLHGVSPDRTRLAYVHLDDLAHPGRLAVMEPHGQPVLVHTGAGHLDGPEWSPDGAWIYVNTEAFTDEPGHAQIARIADADGSMERLVTSDTVDWFPHLSPDAQHAAYISFPPGTLGHPPDVDVEVRVVATTDWSDPLQRYPVFGGQGTINVNSWAPDSSRFAFVAYPFGPDSEKS
jgi:TolB protein